MTGVANHTVLKLLEKLGCACAEYHEKHVRNLRVRRVQCDEIWAFVYAKQEERFRGTDELELATFGRGPAIDAETKLIISYMLGDRGIRTAIALK
jgi:hypothetical protein